MATRQIPAAPDWDFDDEAPAEYEPGPTFSLGGEKFHCMAVPPLGAIWRLEGTNIIDRRRGQILSAVPDAIGFVEDVLCVELPAEVQPEPEPVVVAEGEEKPAAKPAVLVMEPCDDVERWKILLDDKSRPIKSEKLAEIVNRLYAYYGNRPTNAS